MRQTRRSRSAAATPQKDEPGSQDATAEAPEKDVKANLGTVFEQECDSVQEGAVVEGTNNAESGSGNDSISKNEPSSPEKTISPAKQETSPQKSSGVIELNCQVCNCSFTNYHEHMNSEAHKALINHSNPKTDAQNNADKSSPKAGPVSQAQKRFGDRDGAPSPKRMKTQSNANNASKESYRCDVCNLTILMKLDYEHHMSGKKHFINVNRAQGKSYCEICKLFFTTVTDYNDHTESQLHKKNLADKKQDKRFFDCTICNISQLAEKQYEQHLTSKRHKRSLEQPAAGQGNSTKVTPANAVNGTASKPKVEDSSSKKWLFICNACNFFCSQDHQFTTHINQGDHKAAVTELRKKGLVKEKNLPAQGQPAKPPQNTNTAAPSNTVAKTPAPVAKPAFKPGLNKNFVKASPSGPVANTPAINNPAARASTTGVRPNTTAPAVTAKQGPVRKDAQGANRKVPVVGPKRLMNTAIPNAGPLQTPAAVAMNQNNRMQNPQPLKLGMQKLVFEPVGNYGLNYGNPAQESNSNVNFGLSRPYGNYEGRSDNLTAHSSSVREDFRDFRGNTRDDYRNDIRDIRNVNLSDDRSAPSFRAGFYREVPVDSARDTRGDYRNTYRNDMPIDNRSEIRSNLVVDTRGELRSLVRNDVRNDVGNDLRGYGSNDVRGGDLRNDSRSDYLRDRSSLSSYGSASGYYRGAADDFRSDSYPRAGQTGGSSGNYTGSSLASANRYDSYNDRSISAYDNQYSGSSRGVGYMGSMSLNGR